MVRQFNNDYYPDYDDQEFLYSDDIVAMNKDTLKKTQATPFMVSSQVAVKTKQYEQRYHKQGIRGTVISEAWAEEYKNNKSYWIPENKWVHETNLKPVMIEDGLYAIYNSADIYFLKEWFEYKHLPNGKFYRLPLPKPISRTLYQHLELDNEKNKNFLFTEEQIDEMYKKEKNDLFPYWYKWTIRWLPNHSAKLTFFTDEEIEKRVKIKIDHAIIEVDEDVKTVEVPVQVYLNIRSESPYIKHDELVMYLKVEKI